MTEYFHYRDLTVELRRSARRTVDLTVDRGGEVVMAIPKALSKKEIEKILREKELWLYQTLGKKRRVLHERGPKEYVSGEGFYYLGKKYRLKVYEPPALSDYQLPLTLRQGRFWLNKAVLSN